MESIPATDPYDLTVQDTGAVQGFGTPATVRNRVKSGRSLLKTCQGVMHALFSRYRQC